MTLRSLARALLVRTLAGLFRLLPQVAPDPSQQRVLLIKPDHLGDLLLLTPALRALRAQLPQAQIVALVGPWSEPILRGNRDLDALLICPFPGFTRGGQGPFWQPYLLLLHIALLLRAGAFQTAIVARDDHWWGALLALAAGIPRRVGFAHPLVAPALSEALPWRPDEHVTRQGLGLVEQVTGQTPGEPELRFEPSGHEQRWAQAWLEQHSLGARPIVALQPGSAGLTKLWPAERWVALADQLASSADVLLTGGPGEEALTTAIAAAMRAPSSVMAGEATLGGLAALFQRCAAVVGVDSLAAHLAASQQIPTIRLYGPSDHARFGPWGGPRHTVVRAGLWCSPCGVFERCPRGTQPAECMAAIDVARVAAAVRPLLGGGA